MKKIVPILVILILAGAGFAGGTFLRPSPKEVPVEQTEGEAEVAVPQTETADAPMTDQSVGPMGYVKMNNQFVVPIVSGDRVASVIVLSLSIETPDGKQEDVLKREAKLRDSLLQVLFDHASLGGFSGEFTAAGNLKGLRQGLRERAKSDLGHDLIQDVLITDIARQDY